MTDARTRAMRAKKPMSDLYLQKSGAELLKQRIEERWQKKGLPLPRIAIVKVAVTDNGAQGGNRARYDLRSDMVDGFPPEARRG